MITWIRAGIAVLLLARLTEGIAQVVRLGPDMFTPDHQIALADLDGWIFHAGDDTTWARPDLDVIGWESLKPTALSARMADKDGRVEGWFRISLEIDSAFGSMPLGISRSLWAASDVYVDGRLVQSFGDTGHPYQAYNPHLKPSRPLPLAPGRTHLLALHVVDYETLLTQRELRLQPHNLQQLINLTGPGFDQRIRARTEETYVLGAMTISISGLLLLLFLILLFLNPAERIFQFASILTLSVLGGAFCSYYGLLTETSYPTEKILFILANALFLPVMHALTLLITEWVLRKRLSWITIAILATMPPASGLGHVFNISWPFGIVEMALLGYFGYLLITCRKTIRGAEWSVVIAMTVLTLGSLTWVFLHKYYLDTFIVYENVLKSVVMLSAPILLLLYVALSYKRILNEREQEARNVMRITEEKRQLLEQQNLLLETQVAERTRDLEKTLSNLRATQSQLIQSEKMASLGELTAGIAHEIQNPLNFVNNFSELNRELLEELEQNMANGNTGDMAALTRDIRDNEEKILHHGRRADAIVKGMLQHSRSATGVKESTDLNALAEEYLRLAYHGLRARDMDFQAEISTQPDPNLPKIETIPQDIGRVLLNLINNAFQAVSEKKASAGPDYSPRVTVSTEATPDHVILRVTDNGPGIAPSIADKIFQPFFTTKPTGQGTGLGLSLSYEIVKAHGGTLTIDPSPETGASFIVSLPRNP